MLSHNSNIKRFDFHFGESQRVVMTLPVIPIHTVSVRRVIASQVETVQVGRVTAAVPPGTSERHRTRFWPCVVVLVASAELVSKMRC